MGAGEAARQVCGAYVVSERMFALKLERPSKRRGMVFTPRA